MSMIHNHVKSKHHAKHEGRMQYGLFLKGIGLSMEEALKYWRTQFCKGGIDTDKVGIGYSRNCFSFLESRQFFSYIMTLEFLTGHFYNYSIDYDYGMIFVDNLHKESHNIKYLAVGSWIYNL